MKMKDNYSLYDRLLRTVSDYLSIGVECINNSNINGMIAANASIAAILNIIHSEFDDYMFSSKYRYVHNRIEKFSTSVNKILVKQCEPTLSDWYATLNDKEKECNFVFIKHETFSGGNVVFKSYPLKWKNIPEELKRMKRDDLIAFDQYVINNTFYIKIKKGGETHD